MKKYIFINISMWFHQKFGKYQLINHIFVRKLVLNVLNNWVLGRMYKLDKYVGIIQTYHIVLKLPSVYNFIFYSKNKNYQIILPHYLLQMFMNHEKRCLHID